MKRTIEVEVAQCKKCGCDIAERYASELNVASKRGEYCWDCGTERDRRAIKKRVMSDLKGAVVTGCEAGPTRPEYLILTAPDGRIFEVYTERYWERT